MLHTVSAIDCDKAQMYNPECSKEAFFRIGSQHSISVITMLSSFNSVMLKQPVNKQKQTRLSESGIPFFLEKKYCSLQIDHK